MRALILAAALLGAGSAAAQYPSKPIRVLVPFGAGSSTDIVMRILAQPLGQSLGQPVVVENKPGAATNLGADYVAKAQPDGYTILLGDVATFAANPSLYKKLPFDPDKDFAPITLTARFVSVLVANPNRLKVNSVAELIAAAKAEPGKIVCSDAGVGSATHMAFERFRKIHRQHRDPILASFAVTNRNAEITKIEILDSQPHALHQAQSASIKQSGHESVRTMEMRE